MINQAIVSLLPYLPKNLVWIFSARYIAGTELHDALDATRRLNNMGMKATMDLLGEFQTRFDSIQQYKAAYLQLIEESVKMGLDNSFSVKPTMFGLLLDYDLCYASLKEIVAKAASLGRFVRIDMEDSKCTDLEISLYKKLLDEFPGHVGLVLQAYLHRTLGDLQDLLVWDKNRGWLNIRICKGIYNESKEIAFKGRDEIRRNFLICLEYMLRNHIYAAVATHDKELISVAFRMAEAFSVPSHKIEFQMLYGVTPELRKSVMNKGFSMRVYVPYGKDWFNYSTRRLKENPVMALYILKALLVRG